MIDEINKNNEAHGRDTIKSLDYVGDEYTYRELLKDVNIRNLFLAKEEGKSFNSVFEYNSNNYIEEYEKFVSEIIDKIQSNSPYYKNGDEKIPYNLENSLKYQENALDEDDDFETDFTTKPGFIRTLTRKYTLKSFNDVKEKAQILDTNNEYAYEVYDATLFELSNLASKNHVSRTDFYEFLYNIDSIEDAKKYAKENKEFAHITSEDVKEALDYKKYILTYLTKPAHYEEAKPRKIMGYDTIPYVLMPAFDITSDTYSTKEYQKMIEFAQSVSHVIFYDATTKATAKTDKANILKNSIDNRFKFSKNIDSEYETTPEGRKKVLKDLIQENKESGSQILNDLRSALVVNIRGDYYQYFGGRIFLGL